jgi:predicted small secreted protein
MKKLVLVVGLLAVLALLFAGCSAHVKGMDDVRALTDAEKDRAVEAALATPEAVAALADYGAYTTQFRWVAMYWYGNKAVMWWMDYDVIEGGLPADIPEEIEYYIEVDIKFGEPTQYELRVAVNPETGKVAYTAAAE